MTEDERNNAAIEIGAKLPGIVRELVTGAGVEGEHVMAATMSALVVALGAFVQIWTRDRGPAFLHKTVKMVASQIEAIGKTRRQ